MEKLEEGNYYHIYNRGINGTDLFLDKSNFPFFLNNYAFYSLLTMETYAYCLMKNHFHFLVKIRSEEEQKNIFSKFRRKLEMNGKQWIPYGCDYSGFKKQSVSRQFAHLFDKYAKNFNNWNRRTGKLFETPLKEGVLKMNMTSFN